MPNSQKTCRSNVHDNYRDFQESAIEDQRLNRRAVAKALDIPYETVRDLSVTNGVPGWLAALMLGTGLLGGVGGALGLVSLFTSNQATVPQVIEKVIESDRQVDVEIVPPSPPAAPGS